MKKSKKVLSAVIMGILSLTLISCGKEEKPKQALENAFTEIKEDSNDSDIKFFEFGMQREGLGQTSDFADADVKEHISKAFGKLQFKINNESVNDDVAVYEVSVVGPNISLVLSNTAVKRVMNFNSTFSVNEEGVKEDADMSDNNINDILKKSLIESFEDVKTDDRTGTVTVKKVDGKWTVEENDSFIELILGKSN